MFPSFGECEGICMQTVGSYLKKHSEALFKDGGIENACTITDKSKALLGRYYSDNPEHYDRYMPIDAVAALEKTASFPQVIPALSEVIGATLSRNSRVKFKRIWGRGCEFLCDCLVATVCDSDVRILSIHRRRDHNDQRSEAVTARNCCFAASFG